QSPLAAWPVSVTLLALARPRAGGSGAARAAAGGLDGAGSGDGEHDSSTAPVMAGARRSGVRMPEPTAGRAPPPLPSRNPRERAPELQRRPLATAHQNICASRMY